MKKRFIVSVTTLTFLSMLYACNNKSANTDRRCPALVEKAEYYNARTADGVKEGPMGMGVSVEYVDSVYRIIQIVDESIIPTEKIMMSYGNMKQNMIVGISSSSGSERRDYQQMVDYRVAFEHIVKSKNTGNVIVRNTMTPDEIAEALKRQLTPLDELRININTLKQTLPREMETGYTITDILFDDEVVTFEIKIDERMKDFDQATIIRQWPKENQAITLFDLTTGQTFYGIAAKVPVEIHYHFIGSNEKRELAICFSHDEVVKYNGLMNKILENLK